MPEVLLIDLDEGGGRILLLQNFNAVVTGAPTAP
jgi:hypothetical protein